jgi:hypothetical protein
MERLSAITLAIPTHNNRAMNHGRPMTKVAITKYTPLATSQINAFNPYANTTKVRTRYNKKNNTAIKIDPFDLLE